MTERKPGWYWVKDDVEGWHPAQWLGRWCSPFVIQHGGLSDSNYLEIGPRIPTPDELWQCVPVEATRSQESDAEDYWQSKRFAAFSDDPRTWAGVYQAMVKAAPKPEDT